ncbi:MAG: glycosyl transferase, partial [Bacteroidota bacterium]
IYKAQMINDNLKYIDWSLGGASPKILTIDDIDKISKSGKFFARKFDANFDSEVLDWIDTNLLT